MSCSNYSHQYISNKKLLNMCGVVVCGVVVYQLIDSMKDFHFDVRLKKKFFAISGSLMSVNIFYKLITK